MTTLTELRAELDALRAATERMTQIATAGGLVDLTALEDSVAAFCGRLKSLPPVTGRELRGGLIALTDDLGRLDAFLRRTRDEVAERLGESTQRRRATLAYGAAPLNK
jgi:hypothetical protein